MQKVKTKNKLPGRGFTLYLGADEKENVRNDTEAWMPAACKDARDAKEHETPEEAMPDPLRRQP